jgi:octaprenyl-diphosphate synthase
VDDIGKPKGLDIKEKKVTLPLIFALNKASKPIKKQMINLVKNHGDDEAKINQIINFVRESGGLAYAEEQMFLYQQQAFDILYNFPESEFRAGLENLVKFTTERKK